MSLEKYEDKRNFNNTTESAAKTDVHKSTTGGHFGTADVSAGAIGSQVCISAFHANTAKGNLGAHDSQINIADMPAFVVQKHYASRLHFDFRLELDEVLKSWAIPKGPSINPKDKRLAVMVEDHPLEYKDFEGVIPEGNYGAGKVYRWDSGTYYALGASNREESSKILRAGLQKGHLTFILNGTILKGEFALVRLRKASPKDWLLIKKNDEFVGKQDISKLKSADEIAENKEGLNEILFRF